MIQHFSFSSLDESRILNSPNSIAETHYMPQVVAQPCAFPTTVDLYYSFVGTQPILVKIDQIKMM